jgi:hypothetical protein
VREKRPSPGGVEELDDDELVLREVACVQRQHRLLCGASTLVHRKIALFIKKIGTVYKKNQSMRCAYSYSRARECTRAGHGREGFFDALSAPYMEKHVPYLQFLFGFL